MMIPGRVTGLALAMLAMVTSVAAAQAPPQTGVPVPTTAASPAAPAAPVPSTAGMPGCTNVAPGSKTAQKAPGSGEMTTSATGMMTDPGRHTVPCPVAKLP